MAKIPPWLELQAENDYRIRMMRGAVMAEQCCPMDTYDTDSAGDLRPVCTCGDDCPCMCLSCMCDKWGDEDDE